MFVVYCILKKNRPFVNAELVLPSLISGVIWAIAQGLFIVCMGHLSVSVAGPIASIVPGAVASVWSVFYFKEIKVSNFTVEFQQNTMFRDARTWYSFVLLLQSRHLGRLLLQLASDILFKSRECSILFFMYILLFFQ